MTAQPLVTSDSNPILCSLIAQRIAESPQQQITFAEYMDLVLYEPQQGYYATNTVNIGAAGDFFTAPHLGNDFGELLAEQFFDIWQGMERPVPFTLVEMGAGQGILASDLLRYVQSQYPDFFNALEYIIVEKATALLTEQQQRLQDFVNNWGRLRWLTLEEIAPDSITGCCFSNELIDAFPVHRFVVHNGQLQEIYVRTKDQSADLVYFEEAIAEPSTPRLTEYFELVEVELPGSIYPEGFRSEINLAALDWIRAIATRLQRGYLLTIDYGYTAAQYYNSARKDGTLQCHYHHTINYDPYSHIGQQDITAHVDFTALKQQGTLCGLETVGFTQQGLFLMALGLGDRLAANNAGETGLNLSGVIRRREALHLLINPLGLGGFRVLIQSKGLEQAPLLKGLKLLG
jgi:SAM-dependent MidA family methyltransferase